MLSFDECISRGVRMARRAEIRRRRRRRAVALSVTAVVLLGSAATGATLTYMGRKADELRACERTVETLSDSYSRASDLYDEMRGVFERGDAGYDLDSLAAAYDIAPPIMPELDCSADPGLSGVDTDSLAKDLDDYVSWLEGLLHVGG